MADINSYALEIALQFDTNAPEVLGGVQSQLEDINTQIAQIAQSFDGNLGAAAAQMQGATEGIAKSIDEINGTINQSQEIMEDMSDIQQEDSDRLIEDVEQAEQLANNIERVGEAWEDALDAHVQINHQQDQIVDGVDDIDNGMNRIANNTDRTARGFWEMFFGIEALKAAFASMLEYEEDFVTANYRAYGAIEDLVGQVNAVSDEYDVLRSTAHEAMKFLAVDLRVHDEELHKTAGAVGRFHRATGASIKQTSEWARSMTLAGFTSRDTERSLARMVMMMRQAGFTTEQINKQLQQQTNSIGFLAASYDKEGIEAWNAGAMAMSALTREVHGDVDAMMALTDVLIQSDAALDVFRGRSTIAADSLAGMNKAQQDILRSASGFLNYFEEIDNATKGLDPRTARITFGAYGKAINLTAGQMSQLNITAKNLRDEMGLQDPEELLKRMLPMMSGFQDQNRLLKEFGDAMYAVRAAWQQALLPLENAWINLMLALKPVIMFIINAIGILADVLAFLINTIAAIINPMAAFKRQVDDAGDAGERAAGFFEKLGGGIVNLAKAIPGLIVGIAALVGLYYGLKLVSNLFTNWINRMRPTHLLALATALLAFGAASLMVATSLAIIASLGWRAASALGVFTVALALMMSTIFILSAVADTAKVSLTILVGIMLAFGAALLMMAGSIWIIAEAMKTIVDVGWGAAAALAAVGVVIFVMTKALLALGMIATPIAPGILAVGAAFLMMGAAVWLAAKAFEIIVESFSKLGESAMEVVQSAGALAAAVVVISGALLALAVVGAVTALPLLALGAALITVGIAAKMIASAFEAAAEVIKAFSSIENVKAAIEGMELAITSMMYTLASISVILAPVLPLMFVAAAALLAVGAGAWLVAKAVDVMAGAMEKFADLDGVIAALTGLGTAVIAFAAISLAVAPAIPAMIALGVAMVAIGAGAWLMSKALVVAVEAIEELASTSIDEIVLVGDALTALGSMLAFAGVTIAAGSVIMLPASLMFAAAMVALSGAMAIMPVEKLRAAGEGFGKFAEGFSAIANLSTDQISAGVANLGSVANQAAAAIEQIADLGQIEIDVSFDQVTEAIDEIAAQTARVENISSSFERLNRAIEEVLRGPQGPVYGDVAAALRGQMDSIEEQVARAEAFTIPLEDMAEQAELAAALGEREAPSVTLAESVVPGGTPGENDKEEYRSHSNFINLRRQTDLLNNIEKAMPPKEFADILQNIVNLLRTNLFANNDQRDAWLGGGEGDGMGVPGAGGMGAVGAEGGIV